VVEKKLLEKERTELEKLERWCVLGGGGKVKRVLQQVNLGKMGREWNERTKQKKIGMN